MDKKELAYKLTQSAISRCGALLDDEVMTKAFLQLFDDYQVIGDADPRGDWDWHGYVEVVLPEESGKMSVYINVYGEEWAGDGRWSMVAYTRGTDGCTDTKQLVGTASFYYHTSHAITRVAKQVAPVQVISDNLTSFSGVMCDPDWRKDVVNAVVDNGKPEKVRFRVPMNSEVEVSVSQILTREVTFFVWANGVLVGKATIDAGTFWNTVLS